MPDGILFSPRLKPDVDAKLRRNIRRRGDVVKFLVLILKTVDLSTIPLLEISSDIQDLAVTTVKLPSVLHAKLKKVAAKRRSSMNVLLNSAVWAYATEEDEASQGYEGR